MTSARPVAVLTAAGSGSRLGADVPKALVPLVGEPLVVHALRALVAAGVEHVVVTAPADHLPAVRAACAVVGGAQVEVVAGGASRQGSVHAGLRALPPGPGDACVLVHDAARPLAPVGLLRRVVAAVCAGHPAVVPALPVTDTVVRVAPERSDDAGERSLGAVDRTTLRAVQTPQGFPRALLVAAHEAAADRAHDEATAATDDAALVAALGHDVLVVPGDPLALKITVRHDLAVARLLLEESR
ncbi:2-C-methyl-D-erythritol 4-phosphate cytidylyltransferase [Luteimicrobium subarcticum]|uniref:2-C-methyl-D-erythritol 4-phosphate cytidylyltransferase n=1 Tax=Luteimicrobium subarcticum TaxID=620910 RepID=A0A2M8WSV1_9MICO|nr:2-C-methyl-D-erythritol 4-phosphate cytidylyltransferase [Luteimicrobium subarcticum]PJI93968.1 2-C-methyl-D-erythritol 4-phosphate cytidylyltransferase [Luteimicrobium subarcticum]